MRQIRQQLPAPDRIDWFTVLSDLQRLGLRNSSVADLIGVPKGTLLGWKEGAQPKYSDGERLVELWMRRTERERLQLPKVALPW